MNERKFSADEIITAANIIFANETGFDRFGDAEMPTAERYNWALEVETWAGNNPEEGTVNDSLENIYQEAEELGII